MDGVSDAVEVALLHSHLLLRYLLLVVSGRFSWCQEREKVVKFLARGPRRWVPGSAGVLAAAARVGETYIGKEGQFCRLARMMYGLRRAIRRPPWISLTACTISVKYTKLRV